MKDINDLQKAWKSHEEKLEKSWRLNLELLKRINVKNAQSKMTSLIWMNALTLVFYQVVMWFCLFFIFSHRDSIAFILSGTVLVFWAAIISFGAIKQLKLILEINYAQPVTRVQKQLQKVKLAMVYYLRMALMILPFYVVFPTIFFEKWFGVNFIETMDTTWLIVQPLVLILPTIWIYRKLSPKNAQKKWLNWLLVGHGSQINEAQQFLQEIKKFEKS